MTPASKSLLFALALALTCSLAPVREAAAESLVATVNDDPVTSYDVEQRIKLLKALKRPASPDAALESIIADRLRLQEFKKYKLTPGVGERNNGIAKVAAEMKMQPQALAAAVQASGAPEAHWSDFFTAEAGWTMLTRSLNKGLEVSENEVRAELAKRGGRNAAATEYILRQIILVSPISAGAEGLQKRLREAEQLRQRFTSCESGLAMARAMPETVVKEQFSRAGASLPDDMREVLEKMPVGRLTAPGRAPTGVEMIALCDKRDARDDNVAGEEIRNELLARKIDAIAAKSYADLRKRAVVVKRS